MLRGTEDHARLVADKLANGKEPKEARRPAPHNRYRSTSLSGYIVHETEGACQTVVCRVTYSGLTGEARMVRVSLTLL